MQLNLSDEMIAYLKTALVRERANAKSTLRSEPNSARHLDRVDKSGELLEYIESLQVMR